MLPKKREKIPMVQESISATIYNEYAEEIRNYARYPDRIPIKVADVTLVKKDCSDYRAVVYYFQKEFISSIVFSRYHKDGLLKDMKILAQKHFDYIHDAIMYLDEACQ